jgi:hypothetical protein
MSRAFDLPGSVARDLSGRHGCLTVLASIRERHVPLSTGRNCEPFVSEKSRQDRARLKCLIWIGFFEMPRFDSQKNRVRTCAFAENERFSS